jgi:hypothetical protein
MALFPFSASIDLTGAGKGRRLAAWHLSQGAGAQTINFRSGTAAGPIQFQVQLATVTSASQAYATPSLPYFPAGLYIEITGSGFNTGSVELV